MSAPSGPDVAVVSWDDDPFAWLARRLGRRIAAAGPVLDRVVILLPELQHAPRLRRLLQAEAEGCGHSALLGPRIRTLPGFVQRLSADPAPVLAPDARTLVLLRALRAHRGLFGQADPWQLADGLLGLFSELGRHQVALPGDATEFAATLQRGYAIHGPAPAHLGREATIVHTLWRAWREELQALGYRDAEQAFALHLEHTLAAVPPDLELFLVGFTELTPAECVWVRRLLERGQATVVLHGALGGAEHGPQAVLTDLAAQLGADPANPPPDPYGAFLDAAFAGGETPLRTRAASFAAAHGDSPAHGRLALLAADDGEQEARAVELQVRRWLLEGAETIGIVTEDRRLARRIRALLERAGVTLQDSGGWALSTTSAATVVERWLQAVEEDFAHQPLLDLLKSPFLLPADPEAAAGFRRAVYRFEQDIVRHENIARGLERYRTHLRYRRDRLGWPAHSSAAVEQLLQRLEAAAAPLARLLTADPQPLHRYLDALDASLERLGVTPGLARDAAGTRVLERLASLRDAARRHPLDCRWLEFRAWLGASLERDHFRPATTGSPVQLLSLEQSRLARFDALVIAGAERDLLPGSPADSAYFNDGVRRELGLPTRSRELALRWHHFRRLLQAAPRVLVSRRREQDGEEILPCPWVEALETFHRAAYGRSLEDRTLCAWVERPECQVRPPEPAPPPPPTAAPRPRLPARAVPRALTAAAHQRLIDCPYQFFSADCLRLRSLDEIREALEKSDYGERVHRCLQAFHGNVRGLPGPFGEPVRADSRERAIALLEDIARAVFAEDLEDNFQHRGWLRRWLQLIPDYVDWEIRRQRQWLPQQVEQARERTLADGWRLRGRLDRVDGDAQGQRAILDYKTGRTPAVEEVLAGEAVQLTTYALLEPAAQVEYLRVDETSMKTVGIADADTLQALSRAVEARLVEVLTAAAESAPLPAWGDAETCSHCAMPGVCRRDAWSAAGEGDG